LRLGLFSLSALLLVTLFIVVSFPTDRARRLAEHELERLTGGDVSVGAFRPAVGWQGPQLRLEAVKIRWTGTVPLSFSRLELRPAWSTAWLHGAAWAIHLEGDLGRLDGVTALGSNRHFRGTLRGLKLRRLLALTTLWHFDGVLDADLDLVQNGNRLQGTASLRARDGAVRLPNLVVPLPFERSKAQLRFGQEALLEIESLRMSGPLFSMQVTGTLGDAVELARAPLELEVRLYAAEPGVRAALASEGISFDPAGDAILWVRGTLEEPILQ
jgi:type II secretion system protein N